MWITVNDFERLVLHKPYGGNMLGLRLNHRPSFHYVSAGLGLVSWWQGWACS